MVPLLLATVGWYPITTLISLLLPFEVIFMMGS